MILSITSQFVVHLTSLIFLVSQAKVYAANEQVAMTNTHSDIHSGTSNMTLSSNNNSNVNITSAGAPAVSVFDSTFAPNLVNSAVFIISCATQLATFAINYKVNRQYGSVLAQLLGFIYVLFVGPPIHGKC